jgi:hypothetical protein
MSVNRYKPHVFVLPEDDANRQIANGFLLSLSTRQIQVLPEVGGWLHVRDQFASDHLIGMDKYPDRHMILLVDLDGDQGRVATVKAGVPGHLTERVFVLGALSEPEDLRRQNLGSYEAIGRAMAADCRDGTEAVWAHSLLKHNAAELARLQEKVRPFLF